MTDTNTGLDKTAVNASKIAGELARGIMSGDMASGNKFVETHYRWLMFIIRRKFSGTSCHEDIVQDAFMLVITKLQKGEVNNPDTIRAYLRTSAINIGYEYVRKDKKYASAVDQDYLDIFADAKENVATNAEWQDGIRYVKQVMEELPTQRDKDILTKFYFKEEDKKSICAELELSSAHFDRVLYRAKQRLKELITKDDDNNDQSNTEQNKKNDLKNKAKNPNNLFKAISTFVNKSLMQFFASSKRLTSI